ncbi:MAG TPA: hypothetical protein VFK89_06200, partial [Actinomycetota bacterium]|nr:hypothetical protein [Actinomycetota bacterium]
MTKGLRRPAATALAAILIVAAAPLLAPASARTARSACPLNVVPRDRGWTSIEPPDWQIDPGETARVGDPVGAEDFAVLPHHPE